MTSELVGAARLARSPWTFARHAVDIMLYRLLRIIDLPFAGRERTLSMKGGIELIYRLNRGDIQGIREVWIDEAYRLPFPFDPAIVIDLGANIGLTSVFLATRHQCNMIIAVEPDPSNARLVRENLARNGVVGEVVEAAAGPVDGTGYFEAHHDSNLGRLGTSGKPIKVVSMKSLLARTPHGVADLVKIDIEGGEGPLLDSNPSWLDHVGAIIIEFHPTVVDYQHLISVLQTAGFRYVPSESAWPGSMDSFYREGWTSRGS